MLSALGVLGVQCTVQFKCAHCVCFLVYSTTPRNGNRANGNHLEICLSSSQKNGNSLTWVLVALSVCFTYPVLYRVSSESRARRGRRRTKCRAASESRNFSGLGARTPGLVRGLVVHPPIHTRCLFALVKNCYKNIAYTSRPVSVLYR